MTHGSTDACNENPVHRNSPPAYNSWRRANLTAPGDEPDIVRKVDETMKENAENLVSDVMGRLKDTGSGKDAGEFCDNPRRVSLWDILLALELADPTSRCVNLCTAIACVLC